MFTHTYTVFYSDDNEHVMKLRGAIVELQEEWEAREPHVSPGVRARMQHRLTLLWTAAHLLTEPTGE